ncbi:MAG: riboflavin synthase [Actinomycetota bacterium]|nr:riboflavin synthase [Actinomycetota bacterium]
MFTGIVRERGRVAGIEPSDGGARLEIEAPETATETAIGDSVSISGVCLTAVEVRDGRLRFEAVPETLARTALGSLAAGAEVNVEPALRAGDLLGGHYVQGHVDGVGRVRSVEREGEGARVWIETPEAVLRYCAEKGSIAVDGVSLTIAELAADAFAVALVPHTLAVTTLTRLEPDDSVNLEADVLAKYVERLVAAPRA